MGNTPGLEKANHQEVALSQKVGATNLQLALFSDRLKNMALIGAMLYVVVSGPGSASVDKS